MFVVCSDFGAYSRHYHIASLSRWFLDNTDGVDPSLIELHSGGRLSGMTPGWGNWLVQAPGKMFSYKVRVAGVSKPWSLLKKENIETSYLYHTILLFGVLASLAATTELA